MDTTFKSQYKQDEKTRQELISRLIHASGGTISAEDAALVQDISHHTTEEVQHLMIANVLSAPERLQALIASAVTGQLLGIMISGALTIAEGRKRAKG